VTCAVEVTLRLGAPLRPHAGGHAQLAYTVPDDADVGRLLDALAADHPAAARRIRDETGLLRQHVNVFVDREPVPRRTGTEVVLHDAAEVLILPAVSGGAR
jgi:molybdopterin synthase sulfur carrier subunit